MSTATPAAPPPSRADASLSKSERAHAHLLAQLDAGAYRTGDRLVLSAIAEELGISVVPVREAVRRLEAEGLVVFEKNVGATVAALDEAEYHHTMQTLGVVEGAATALAAPHLSTADLAEAERINEQMRALLEDFDPRAFTELNQRFHAVLHSRCPNPHISDLVQRGWRRLDRLRATSFAGLSSRAAESAEEHAQILSALRSGAGYERIEALTRQHRWNTLDSYQATQNQMRRRTA